MNTMKGAHRLKIHTLFILYALFESSKGVSTYYIHQSDTQTNYPKAIIDMGVDYNDEPVPYYLKNALIRAIANDSMTNMYDGSRGDRILRQSIANFYSIIMNRQLNWETEIITTAGATEALASTFRALSNPGDEWILIEPFFNMFRSAIELANAVPRYSNLKLRKIRGRVTASDWKLDRAEIKSLINNKTRGIMFNNPNNPLGKSYTREELEFIAHVAREHNILVVSDEVHEFTTDTMIKMASLPGMFERTITVGSASKALCVPGWRVGWVFGPAKLIEKIDKVHGDTVNFVSLAQQRAVSTVLDDEYKNFGSPRTFLRQNLASIKQKRNFIVQAFQDAGIQPIVPEGGYCMLAGWSNVDQVKKNYILKGGTFADWMNRSTRIKAFPADKYYGDKHKAEGLYRLRFCYHKSTETLQNAARNLLKLNTSRQKNGYIFGDFLNKIFFG